MGVGLGAGLVFGAIHTFSSYAGKAHIVAGVRTSKNNKFVTSVWSRAIALILSFGLVGPLRWGHHQGP